MLMLMLMFGRWLAVIGLLIPLSTTHSSEANALQSCLGAIHSLSARFRQSTTESGDGLPLEIEGRLYLRTPHDARWEVLQPYRELILYNGAELWRHEPDLEQLTIQTLRPETVPLLLLLDPERIDWRQSFSLRWEQEGDRRTYHVQPLHTTAPAPFTTLRAQFKDCRPHSVWWRDSLGRETAIELSRLRINGKLPERRFKMRIPPGTDVVREP